MRRPTIGPVKHTHPSPTDARSNQILHRSAVVFLLVAMTGCATKYKRPSPPASSATSTPTTQPVREFKMFIAEIDPPAGWQYKLNSQDHDHEHVTWVSPSGDTACGILYFRMPFPVGHELAFKYGFLAEMKRKEGVANVLTKEWDPKLPGLRFTVESKLYLTRGNFFVHGWEGWMVYAGTRLDRPVNETDLKIAERVREAAVFVESR